MVTVCSDECVAIDTLMGVLGNNTVQSTLVQAGLPETTQAAAHRALSILQRRTAVSVSPGRSEEAKLEEQWQQFLEDLGEKDGGAVGGAKDHWMEARRKRARANPNAA